MSVLFELVTPDPDFPGFGIDPNDQLPGRPKEGEIDIATFFEHLQLFVTDEQRIKTVFYYKVFNYLKVHGSPVLGPNVGQFLYENQNIIPVELRGEVTLIFPGKIYRGSGGRCFRLLYWKNLDAWAWGYGLLGGFCGPKDKTVLLKK